MFFSHRRYWLIFVGILQLVSCTKNIERSAPDTVALVNGTPITKNDLVNRLELTVLPNARQASERKQRTLDVLIDELLVSQWAEREGLAESIDYQSAIGFIKQQALIRELFVEEFADHAKPDSQQIQLALQRSMQQLSIRVLFTENREIADRWKSYLQSGKTFVQLVEESADDPFIYVKDYLFSWGDGTVPIEIEDIAYQMKSGELSELLEINQGYLLFEVQNRFSQMIQSENDYYTKWQSVKQILRSRNESRLAAEYVDKLLTHLNITQKASGFNELIRYIEDRLGIQPEDSLAEPSKREKELQVPVEYQLDLPVIETPDFNWTGWEVLNVLRDYGYPVNTKNSRTLRSSLYRFLKGAIRDQYLSERANELGLESNERVQKDIQMWSRYYLYMKGVAALAEGDTTQNKTTTIVDNIRKIREKAQIRINHDVLDTITLTDISMLAFWDNNFIRQLAVPPLKEF